MSAPLISERRRRFLVAPGEGVALSPSIDVFLDRTSQFLEATGLTTDDVVSSPVVQIPIPQGVVDSSGKQLRWDGVRPQMLWHPFFWLPASVSLRAKVQLNGDKERVETDEEYLLRVIVQCVAAGLLDIDDGTWLDVPSSYGIDIDDPNIRKRVIMWESGQTDPLFDQIDLSDRFDGVGIASPIVRDTISQAPMYVLAQWAHTASHIGRVVSDLQEDDRRFGLSQERRISDTAEVLMLALVGFLGGELVGDPEPGQVVADMIDELEEQDLDADVDRIRARLLQLSAQIYASTSPYLQEITEAALSLKADAVVA